MSAAVPTSILQAARLLQAADQPVRILRALEWPESVKRQFFADGARELPKVTYTPADYTVSLEQVAEARRLCPGDSLLAAWIHRHADAIETSANMLASLGTPAFFEHGSHLYGVPSKTLVDEIRRPLDLAQDLERILGGFDAVGASDAEPACHSAEYVAGVLTEAAQREFAARAPQIRVVDQLSANALASLSQVSIRRGACFSARDAAQLVEHELFVHVLTSLNATAQTSLPLLGVGHAGTTRTQEGLAVFAELQAGALEPMRLRRLAQRVLAIQMAIDGADFLEVYQFFLDRGVAEDQAFESTRRVFRGGVLRGGAPFTKDAVYLDGLLRVHDFFRVAVQAGRADCLLLLFCGKLDIADVPALCELASHGLCVRPQYLPPWMRDMRTLVASLAYSTFVDRVELSAVEQQYGAMLASAPAIDAWGEIES